MIETAFKKLYPNKDFNYKVKLTYSKRFKDYNANVKKLGNHLEFGLSHKWKSVSEEIRIGLIQELLLGLFNDKKNSINIDLYNNFIKSLHIAIPKTKTHAVLEESFNRVNEKYFYGLVERPNLVWKGNSKTHLASYDFQSDTISVSNIFRYADEEIMDYLIYHELLHKKLKYYHKNGKSIHHTSEFRKKEKSFENKKMIEKKMAAWIKKHD
jgi:hypothetical protein